MPDFVVNVDSINIFKNLLNTFLSNQEIIYDYTADLILIGIGDRSEFVS